MPAETTNCFRCGASTSGATMEGLCPRCVMAQLLSPQVAPATEAHEEARTEARQFGEHDLLEVIGTGGMGVIWRARHRRLNRLVALKMIRAGLLATPQDRKRFETEAAAVANLDHPNIVSIHEVGECDGNLFFSMRLVEGESLAQRLEHHRQQAGKAAVGSGCDSQEAARLISTVARAVHHAHERGILHRDLKPGNILLDRSGQPLVTDFGLAKRTGEDSDLTLSGAVLGTPNYMAPEQAAANNRQLTIAADIYSLGAILYELLSGRPPFRAETAVATLRQVIDTDAPPPSSINSEVDRQLEVIALKCLAKEPARRYPTAAELADDLDRWLRHEPILARPASMSERLVLWARRRPAVAALSVLTAGLLIAGVAAVLWQWREAVFQRHRADENATHTEAALAQSKESLWQAQFDRARAQRQTRLMGQRVKVLEAIRAAAAFRPTPELRNEAIAALALPDFEEESNWRVLPADTVRAVMDPVLVHYALVTRTNRISVHRLADGSEVFNATEDLPQPDLTFSPDGRFLRAEAESGIRVWNVTNGARVFELTVRDGQPKTTGLSFSTDGRKLARTAGSTFQIYNLEPETGEVLWEQGGLSRLGMCAFNPQSNLLAVRSNNELQIWSIASKNRVKQSAPPLLSAIKLAWRSQGNLLAADMSDNRILIWDTELDQKQFLAGHTREVSGLWFHPSNGMILSFSWDNSMRLWDPTTGMQLLQARGATPLGFSRDGERLIVWKHPQGLGSYRVHGPGVCRLLSSGSEALRINSVGFSPDSKLVVAGNDTGVWLWRPDTGERLAYGAALQCFFAGFVDASNIVSVGKDGLLDWPVTQTADGRSVSLGPPLRSPLDPLKQLGTPALDLLRHRLLLPLPTVGYGLVLDLEDQQKSVALRGHPNISTPTFSPDGRWIASGCWDPVITKPMFATVWDAATGGVITNIPTTKCTVTFSPDSRWLVLGANTVYRLFETGTWKPARTFARNEAVVDFGYSAFSPDGRMLALHDTDRILRLVNPLTGVEYARLTSPDYRILNALSFSSDGRWLAAATEANIQIWDIQLLRRELVALGLDW